MIDPCIEEALESLYLCESEQQEYPGDKATLAAIKNASSQGLVKLDGDGYRLTASGLHAGRNVVRRHRLAERLLGDVLRSETDDRMDQDACRFEHVLQDGLDDKICTLLGHPSQCPHGKPIPEGECCRQAREDTIREVRPLCDATPGDEGTVAYLTTRDNREVQKMMAMGILPGVCIQLIRRFPSYVFQVGYSQFTVDRTLAEVIYVHWASDDTDKKDKRILTR